jgi:hypothetical protein
MDSVTAVDNEIVAWALGTRAVFYPEAEPPRVDLEMPLDGAPGWRLGLLVLVNEGELAIAEVKIFPGGDRLDPVKVRQSDVTTVPRHWSEEAAALEGTAVPTITTRMLRSIRLGEITAALRMELEAQQDTKLKHGVWGELLGLAPSTVGEAFADVLSHSPSRSRQGAIDLARLAQRYAEVVATGSKHPIQDLADELGVKPSHVRDTIFRAREKGYLTRSHGPRPGGSLTQAGRDVLQRDPQASGKSPAGRPRRGATAKSPFTPTTDEGSAKR